MTDEIETPAPEPFELPEDFATQVQGWDVPIESLPEAVAQYKALQTEEGVIDAFIRTGQSLGFGVKELERLFVDEVAQPAPAPATPAAPQPAPVPEDPEALLSRAEVRALIEAERTAVEERFNALTQAEQERQQASENARRQVTFGVINNWFDAHEIDRASVRARTIAQLGEATIAAGADSYDPAIAVAALERGAEAYEKYIETEARDHLARIAARGDALPAVLGGGNTGTGEGEAPVEYKGSGALQTAKDRVRNRLRANGELG